MLDQSFPHSGSQVPRLLIEGIRLRAVSRVLSVLVRTALPMFAELLEL